jgi:hypothetical protein
MDMKKILQAIDGAAAKPQAQVGDMKRFVSIIAEGAGKLNRLTAAESITVNHYTESQPKTVTNPVLNVAKDAKPSMIGKYFKTVEHEFAESTERSKSRAKQLAERVIERVVGGQDGMVYTAPKTEAIGKDDAYTRDYKSSIAGMGKRDSLAYQLDGGANDEGDDEAFLRAQREREQGPWYLRINGKVYKQQGTPKEFNSKKGANAYALAILKKRPEMQGKIMLTKNAEDQ